MTIVNDVGTTSFSSAIERLFRFFLSDASSCDVCCCLWIVSQLCSRSSDFSNFEDHLFDTLRGDDEKLELGKFFAVS